MLLWLPAGQSINPDHDITRLCLRVYGAIVVHQYSIPENEGLTAWLAVGMLDSVGIANRTCRVTKQGKGNIELVRERTLLGNRIHGYTSHLYVVFSQCRKCRPQRLYLFDSSRGIRLRIEENHGPRPGRGLLYVHLPAKLIWSRQGRRAPAVHMRSHILVNSASRQKDREKKQGKAKHSFHPRDHAGSVRTLQSVFHLLCEESQRNQKAVHLLHRLIILDLVEKAVRLSLI